MRIEGVEKAVMREVTRERENEDDEDEDGTNSKTNLPESCEVTVKILLRVSAST